MLVNLLSSLTACVLDGSLRYWTALLPKVMIPTQMTFKLNKVFFCFGE